MGHKKSSPSLPHLRGEDFLQVFHYEGERRSVVGRLRPAGSHQFENFGGTIVGSFHPITLLQLLEELLHGDGGVRGPSQGHDLPRQNPVAPPLNNRKIIFIPQIRMGGGGIHATQIYTN